MTKPEQKKRIEEFEALVVPVVKWLARQPNPHTAIIITNETAQMMEGVLGICWPTDTGEE